MRGLSRCYFELNWIKLNNISNRLADSEGLTRKSVIASESDDSLQSSAEDPEFKVQIKPKMREDVEYTHIQVQRWIIHIIFNV